MELLIFPLGSPTLLFCQGIQISDIISVNLDQQSISMLSFQKQHFHYHIMSMQQFEKLKEQGNNLFKQKNYQDAKAIFVQAVTEIQQSKQQYQSPQSQCGKLYVNLLTNAALCSLNLKQSQEYLNAIQYCDKALKINPDNLKALYRRGLAYKEHGEKKEGGQHQIEEVFDLYVKAKKDLQRLCLLDRKNEIADKKLNETNQNLARLKQFAKEKKTKQKVVKVSMATEEKGPSKVSANMQKIMASYKMEEVVKIAQHKTQQGLISSDLPQTKTDLDKAIKQLAKKPDILKQFLFKFNEGYLQKIDPGFDLLFAIVMSLVAVTFENDNELSKFQTLAREIVKVKSFNLLWKGLVESERKQIRDKLQPIISINPELASRFA